MHPIHWLKWDAKNKEVTFVRQQAMHLRDRPKKMTKNLEFDAGRLQKIAWMFLLILQKVKIDCEIQSLRSDNDECYL